MKKQNTATGTSSALEVIHPKDIIEKHLKPALAPFKDELLAAAALDKKLAAEMDQQHPEAAKKDALALLEKAGAGDEEADKILTEAGGTEAYVRNRTALFDLARAKHSAACKSTAPLWQRVSDSVMAAIDAADAEIQAQWQRVCDHLGEPSDLSRWNAYCRNIRNGVRGAANAAENLNHGAAWQIEAHGLRPLLD